MSTAIARTRAIAKAVADTQVPWVATHVVTGHALVMGALQRETQVRWHFPDLAAYPAETRATSGVSALVSGLAIQQLIALPTVNALVADAHAGNFINRMVRPFLRAFVGCGAQAHYFGREHFTFSKRPAGVLGLDVTENGVWVLEAWVGVDVPTFLHAPKPDQDRPDPPVAPLREPIALREALRIAGGKRADDAPRDLALRVHERLLKACGLENAATDLSVSVEPEAERTSERLFEWFEQLVPIGLLELGRHQVRSGEFEYRLAGDVLTSVAAARAFEVQLVSSSEAGAHECFLDVPFEGAAPADLDVLLWSMHGGRYPVRPRRQWHI
ncbi:MAG: hypothetical protein H6718_08595 [Polyangiaceae bacterium]|nr:hypothetical protein [Polyangiaceae bacterium]